MEELLALHGLSDAEASALLGPCRRGLAPPNPAAAAAAAEAAATPPEGAVPPAAGAKPAGTAAAAQPRTGGSARGELAGVREEADAEAAGDGARSGSGSSSGTEEEDEDEGSGGGDEGRQHGSRRPRRRISFVGRLQDRASGTYSSLRLFGGKRGYSTAITRSIGDRDAARCCIAEPEITTLVVEAHQRARVIACSDGVWDVHSNWEAFAVAKRPLLRGIDSTHVRRPRCASRAAMHTIFGAMLQFCPMHAACFASVFSADRCSLSLLAHSPPPCRRRNNACFIVLLCFVRRRPRWRSPRRRRTTAYMTASLLTISLS